VLDRPDLPVFTTVGTQALARPLCGGGDPFTWTTITDGSRVEVGDLAFTFSRTDHPVETLAVLVESGGASLVYSADTGPGWSPRAFGVRPDVALIEATLDHEHTTPVHLTATQAGERAAEVGARALVLTHLLPGTDPAEQRAAAAAAYDGPVRVAEPGLTVAVGAP
jgi:ribonuclease BN (tRNA processing enzyme)